VSTVSLHLQNLRKHRGIFNSIRTLRAIYLIRFYRRRTTTHISNSYVWSCAYHKILNLIRLNKSWRSMPWIKYHCARVRVQNEGLRYIKLKLLLISKEIIFLYNVIHANVSHYVKTIFRATIFCNLQFFVHVTASKNYYDDVNKWVYWKCLFECYCECLFF